MNQQRNSRFGSLDGLRGLAALVVCIHHAALVSTPLSDPYFSKSTLPFSDWTDWLLVHTPLHLLWEGDSAVHVFFILSGFVLTLPVVKSRRFSWLAYYPSRLLRLYLPVWGGVALAVVTFIIMPRSPDYGLSAWMTTHPTHLVAWDVARDATLLIGAGYTASPLWSLRWEVIFSLTIPAFIWIAVRLRKRPIVLAVAALVVTGLGAYANYSPVKYLPMFMLGVIMAVHLRSVLNVASSISSHRQSSWIWGTLVSAALLACVSKWMVMAVGVTGRAADSFLMIGVIGAAVIVFAALGWKPFARRLEQPAPQFLGKISFSLYLIHEPIIVGLAFLVPSNVWLPGAVGIPLSIGLAVIFYRFIEVPSHRLSSGLRRRVSAGARVTGPELVGQSPT